uniref:Uncharacterized protein n=1 Tax=Anguilla anguilla TaxID=7936 RepID=A0A0E9VNC4_ANGAN
MLWEVGTIDTMLISSMTELNEFVLNLALLAKELQARCILTRFSVLHYL